jgi:uncharacterized protein YacL
MKWLRYVLLIIFAFVNALAFFFILPVYVSAPIGWMGPEEQSLIPLISLVVSTIGTIAMIIFGWRAEVRQAREFKLRIAQLETELAKPRGGAAEHQTNSN